MRERVRVRTGCLVCRARKIKCDEQWPDCQKCIKSKRKCVYKRRPPLMSLRPAPPIVDYLYGQYQDPAREKSYSSLGQNRDGVELNQGHLFPATCTSSIVGSGTSNISGGSTQSSQGFSASVNGGISPDSHYEVSNFNEEEIDLDNASSPSARFYTTSLQMYITTTLDWLGTSGLSSHSFSYFVEEVDSPFISPFDHLNWKRIKVHITQLAIKDESIAAAILALQSTYRMQVNRLPMSHASSEYQASLAAFDLMVVNRTNDFETILIVALLLCLCDTTLPNEDGSAFCGFGEEFETRLTVWLLSNERSPVSLRICAWLQFLHVATKRSGCCGLMPETTFEFLSNHILSVPNLLENDSESASAMYDLVSAPVFAFYLKLQRISNQIQDLSHYRRSRTTPEDQAEVAEIVDNLRGTLTTLWDARPSPLRFQPNQLRKDFGRTISEPLIALAGVCTAAYFGEMIGLRRTLGDDPIPAPESEEPMHQIRKIVDGEWNVSREGAVNPGYVRALFLYSIETMRHDETQWAVARLKQVKSPISRSEFIASLGESLGRAQRMEKRRVATKYFCKSAFNVMVPRM